MRRQGIVVRWNAERAFGFIRSPDTSADVFFHARDFRGAQPPREGLPVVYEEIHVGGKGPRAMAVQPADGGPSEAQGARHSRARSASRTHAVAKPSAAPASTAREPTPTPPRRETSADASASAPVALLFAAVWIGLLGWGVYRHQLPLWWQTLSAVLAMNLITYLVYAADKNAARERRWRVPENHLHLLSLLGGWPGAWLAQQGLRHKSSKQSFRAVYWLTVIAHCAALTAWVMGWMR